MAACSVLCGVSVFVFILVLAGVLRVYWVLAKRNGTRPKRKTPIKVMVVAGSGGHTSEILRLVSPLSVQYKPRVYIIADTDKMSQDKITHLERERSSREGSDFRVIQIPRSREVRQSWVTTVLTTARATLLSIPLVFREKPDLVLTNGPGTCVPICLAAFTMKVLGYNDAVIVYVESICRVKTLSLSGKILYSFADHFFVQWKKLTDRYSRAVYLGRLV